MSKASELRIETERLILRRELPGDYLDAFSWSGDPRVTKYMLADAAQSAEDLIPWFESLDIESEQSYNMIILAKEDMHAIGAVGLFYDREEELWDIAYIIRYEDWGKGYATEAAKGMMDYAVSEHDAKVFQGECAIENKGSAKVLEHLGMKLHHLSSYAKHSGSAKFDSYVYRLDLRD